MTLPSSGAISMSQVNTELGKSSSATISLNDSDVRTLFGVSSGAISMSNGYGKSSAFNATISSHQQQLNLRTWALANGWNGSSSAVITIAPGVYIWSDNTSIAGLTIDGSWPGGITLINQGYIMGKGGRGQTITTFNYVDSNGYQYWNWEGPTNGGPAISLGTSVTIDNTYGNGYIGGGGGGGSAAGGANPNVAWWIGAGGGGAGGGAGGDDASGAIASTSKYSKYYGGAGGAIGSAGGNGQTLSNDFNPGFGGGGGGRIFPGVGGTGGRMSGNGTDGNPALHYVVSAAQGGGAGGGAGVTNWSLYRSIGNNGEVARGGTGGSGSSVAADGYMESGTIELKENVCMNGGGGGWGATGGRWVSRAVDYAGSGAQLYNYGPYGGAGGKAVALNGHGVTWVSGNTTRVYGAVS